MAKPISRKELIRRFHKLGFEGPISGSRHQFMKRGELKIRIPNPHRGGNHRLVSGERDPAPGGHHDQRLGQFLTVPS